MNYPFYQQPINPGYLQNPNQQNVVNNGNPTMPMGIPKTDMIAQQNVFVPVANENVARNYPVGYGNTVIFKDENEPKIYVKQMGYSQLESPIFESYRKEENKPISNEVKERPAVSSYDDLRAEIDDLKGQIKGIKDRLSNRNNQNEKRGDK